MIEASRDDDGRHAAAELGRLVVEAREARGLSQRELARRSGLRRERVGLIERGKTNPRLSVLVDLAKGLGLSIDELVSLGRRALAHNAQAASATRDEQDKRNTDR